MAPTKTRKVPFYTKLDPELLGAMRRYRDAVGVPTAQQVDRALREWLAERPEAWPPPAPRGGKKLGRKRARPRTRP